MRLRRSLYVFMPILTLLLLITCRMDPGFSRTPPAALPADRVLDVIRSSSGPFAYETLLPVALNLTVELYRQPSPAAALERQESGGQLIVVSLWNAKGESLYSGSIPSDGTLSTVLSLPAAPQDVLLRLESPGYESREVSIDGMVLYSEIHRVMGLLSEGLSAKGELMPDTDQDGVPDIYDVDPLDPEAAFKVRTPASGEYTVAFEDLYPVPGDADYNDFVAMYHLVENHLSVIKEEEKEGSKQIVETMLCNLHGEATANDKVAGYSHKFGIVVEFPGHVATRVRRVYYDGLGCRRTDTKENVADKAVIWLFENTSSKNILDRTATFDIDFPKGMTRDMVSIAPYDPVLYVWNTGKDIHMVGKDSLSGPVDGRTYMDSNGYPWALLVPEDWKHPAECQYIGNAYPLFEEWRDSKGAQAAWWYLYPASTSTETGNKAPSQVSSPDSTELVAGYNLTQEFHLVSVDPDPGDTVQFLSSPAPVALQNLYSLTTVVDPDTKQLIGQVIFQPWVLEGDYLFYFWSVDNHGASTIATPFKATFQFRSNASTNKPPSVSFPDWDYLVKKAETTTVNGGYKEQLTLINAYPWYLQEGGANALFNFQAVEESGVRHWGLHSSAISGPVSFSQVTYYSPSSVTPPETGWATAVGDAAATTVLRFPISGSLAVGGMLTAQYVFTDPDGDSEAESGSHYQWYRFDTFTATTGGTAIGTDSRSYTSVADDQYKWLRVEVTPVDEHGTAGTPVLTPKAVQVGAES